jgi:transcriptional regulator with XRE-family HTH domain
VNDFPSEIRPEDTGARLRAIRELSGLSPREVADAAGLSTRELAAVERGRRRLSPDELRALSSALHFRPEVLVAESVDAAHRTARDHDRVDAAFGHEFPGRDPAAPAADIPGAGPFDLPEPERRRDFTTRKGVEDSWSDLRAEMEGVIRQCMRVSTVGSGDDVLALLDSLEADIHRLKSDRSFQRELTRHERTIAAARGRGSGRTREASTNGSRTQ